MSFNPNDVDASDVPGLEEEDLEDEKTDATREDSDTDIEDINLGSEDPEAETNTQTETETESTDPSTEPEPEPEPEPETNDQTDIGQTDVSDINLGSEDPDTGSTDTNQPADPESVENSDPDQQESNEVENPVPTEEDSQADQTGEQTEAPQSETTTADNSSPATENFDDVDTQDIEGLDVEIGNVEGDNRDEIQENFADRLSEQVPGQTFTASDIATSVSEGDGQRQIQFSLSFSGEKKVDQAQRDQLRQDAATEYSEAFDGRDFNPDQFEVEESGDGFAVSLAQEPTEEIVQESTAARLDQQTPDVDITGEDVRVRSTDSGVEAELDLGTRQELAAASFDRATDVDIGVDDVVLEPDSDGFGLTDDAESEVGAQGIDETQVSDITLGEGTTTLDESNILAATDPDVGGPTLGGTTEETQARLDNIDRQQDLVEASAERGDQGGDIQGSGPGQEAGLQGQQTVAPTESQVEQIEQSSVTNADQDLDQLGDLVESAPDLVRQESQLAAATVTEEVVDPAADAAGDVVDVGAQALRLQSAAITGRDIDQPADDFEAAIQDVGAAPDEEINDQSGAEFAAEQTTRGAGNLVTGALELPATAVTAGEVGFDAAQFTGDAIEEEGAVDGTATSLEAAGETTFNAAQRQAQFARNNPFVTAGSLAGSVAVFGAASRVGGTANATARAAIQPGEEILGTALNRVPRVGNRLAPRGEPLIFSEEAAISGARRVGAGIRRQADRVNINRDGDLLSNTRGTAGGQRTISIEVEQETAAETAIEDLPPADAFESDAEFARQRDLRRARAELEADPRSSVEAGSLESEATRMEVERQAARNRLEQRLGQDPDSVFSDQVELDQQIEGLRQREFEGEIERGVQTTEQVEQAESADVAAADVEAEQGAFFETETDQAFRTQFGEPGQEQTAAEPTAEPATDTAFRTQFADEEEQLFEETTETAEETAPDTEQPVDTELETPEDVRLDTEQPVDLQTDVETELDVEAELEAEVEQEVEQEIEQEVEQEVETETEIEQELETALELEAESETEVEAELFNPESEDGGGFPFGGDEAEGVREVEFALDDDVGVDVEEVGEDL